MSNESTSQRVNESSSKSTNVKQKKKKSFTLLEIVFTIVIIGILLAIFMPVISSIKLAAQKVRDVSNLKTIATAWKTYTEKFGAIAVVPRHGLSGGFELVHYLSGGSLGADVSNVNLGKGWLGREKCILNDPYIYVSSQDKYASKIQKEIISDASGRDCNAYLKSYQPITNDLSNDVSLSYCIISGLSSSVPLDRTPLGFSRGLKTNGKWHPKYGLYGDKGGYVVFCDGHVTWFDGSRPAKFLTWDQNGYSTDIRDAIPNSAFISSGWNLKNNIKDTDNSLLLIYHNGTGGE
jgi:prepilin-type processing-associated H-X9-DG protein